VPVTADKGRDVRVEVPYLSYGPDAANVLFQVVNDRYLDQRPMIFTTNKPLAASGRVLHGSGSGGGHPRPHPRPRTTHRTPRTVLSHAPRAA